MDKSLKKLQSLLTEAGRWGDRLEASVADPKFKELKEYAKEVRKAQSNPSGATEAPLGIREESP